MVLVKPSLTHLASYRAALERHWGPNTMDPDAWQAELRQLDEAS